MKIPIMVGLLVLFLSACAPKEYCSVLDKRFSCAGSMDSSGAEITFNKLPSGKFTVGRINIEKFSEENSESKDCYVTKGNIIEKGIAIKLDCKPFGEGRYTVKMRLYHSEPASYNPVSGETCLKSGQNWQCDSSAFFTVNI